MSCSKVFIHIYIYIYVCVCVFRCEEDSKTFSEYQLFDGVREYTGLLLPLRSFSAESSHAGTRWRSAAASVRHTYLELRERQKKTSKTQIKNYNKWTPIN